MKLATDCKHSTDNKAFWAPYISIACHNAYLAVKYITESMVRHPEKPDRVDDQRLYDAAVVRCLNPQGANDTKPAAYVQRVMVLLDKHFPFLRKMLQYNRENDSKQKGDVKNTDRQLQLLPLDYYDAVHLILKTLADLRNTYLHAAYDCYQVRERELYRYMEVTFDAAVRTVKNRFELSDADVEHLRKCDSRGNRKRSFKYGFRAEDKASLTTAGLAFFICLFLDKHHTALLLKQLPALSDTRDTQQHAAIETYSVYRTILPRRRIEVGDDSKALGLDMLNELQRCPDILFGLLSKEDKEHFKVKTERPGDAAADEDSETETLMRRNGDRFPYLAMRFLDTQEVFQKIRFHVDLGTYYFDCYDKTLVDGVTERRYLSSHIKGFGRIQELEAKYRQEKKELQPASDTFESYLTLTNPHYHTNSPLNSQIGIKFSDCEPILDGNKPDRASLQPDAWLSLYELPAMIFLTLLPSKEKEAKNAEQLVEEYYRNVRHIFSLVKDNAEELQPYVRKEKNADDFYAEFGISLGQLPKELAEYICGEHQCESPHTDAKKRLQWFIDDSIGRLDLLHRKLDSIRKNQVKLGKPKYPMLNESAMATFLAEDMLRMQPSLDPNGRDKLSSPNYSSLQANIALFGVAEKREQLPHILQKCGLIGHHSPNVHPFLHELDLNACKRTDDLYKAYLQKRKSYFVGCLQNNALNVYALRNSKLEHKLEGKERYYQQLAEKLLQLPINLPRSLFHTEIVKRLKQYPELQEVLSQERINTVYLIQLYVERVLNDSSQAFYQMKRHYRFWDKLFFEGARQPRQYPAVFKSTDNELLSSLSSMVAGYVKSDSSFRSDRQGKSKHPMLKSLSRFSKDEKTLRLYKVQDMLLFMMAKQLLSANIPTLTQMQAAKLGNIMPNNKHSLLEQAATFSMQVSLGKQGSWQIVQEKMRLKSYGNFRHIALDYRLPNLLPWCNTQTISHNELQQELRHYDKLRLQAFEKTYKLKQVLHQAYGQNIQADDVYNQSVELLLYFYRKYPHKVDFTAAELTPEVLATCDPVVLIYRAFVNNDYPGYSLFANKVQQKPGSVADHLYTLLASRLDDYMASIHTENTQAEA